METINFNQIEQELDYYLKFSETFIPKYKVEMYPVQLSEAIDFPFIEEVSSPDLEKFIMDLSNSTEINAPFPESSFDDSFLNLIDPIKSENLVDEVPESVEEIFYNYNVESPQVNKRRGAGRPRKDLEKRQQEIEEAKMKNPEKLKQLNVTMSVWKCRESQRKEKNHLAKQVRKLHKRRLLLQEISEYNRHKIEMLYNMVFNSIK
jgi:hypothetical protein